MGILSSEFISRSISRHPSSTMSIVGIAEMKKTVFSALQ